MALSTERHGERDTALERLVFFSDAVFAIAITLLALEIHVPEVDAADPGALPRAVLATAPAILAFAVSFLVIGSYWLAHHRIFRHIERYDRRLLWLNLVFLLAVAFMPFPSGVLARYGDTPFASGFYAASLALAGTALCALWCYATWHHRLVPDTLPTATIRANTLRLVAAVAILLLSVAVAAVSPYAAESGWALTLLIRPAAEHLGAPPLNGNRHGAARDARGNVG